VDPHSFEPAPSDVRKVADSDVLIVNGAGLESFLGRLLQNTGGQRQIVEASRGLSSRQPGEAGAGSTSEVDPHFWLDPVLAITYVENIRDGLIQADPAGKETYVRNADGYMAKLRDLDTWIADRVKQIPPDRRILVTNHEEFGYFADRYGFKIVGAIVPSVTTGASPSARELADLAEKIKASGAPAIFLEVGANAQLADQLARETGVEVVTGLFTHSLTPQDGKAPDYLQMMRQDTSVIVSALQ
jgi:ABC-type Zn uptake system ZnuABC Zn-binding protein ZnuA